MEKRTDENRCCKTCDWHDDFSWVCFNGDSPYCADFTGNDSYCPAWEKRRDGAEKGVET